MKTTLENMACAQFSARSVTFAYSGGRDSLFQQLQHYGDGQDPSSLIADALTMRIDLGCLGLRRVTRLNARQHEHRSGMDTAWANWEGETLNGKPFDLQTW